MASRRKRQSIKGYVIAVVVAIAVIVGGYFLLHMQAESPKITEHSDEKYYFADSKYQGIRSKFVTRHSSKEDVSLEYPVTGKNEIDNVIAAAIDKDDALFREAVSYGSQFDQPMTAATSYQVTLNDEKFLSVIVTTNQDTHGAHPVLMTHFWTFRKDDGSVVTLRDIAGGSDAAVKELLSAAKNSIDHSLKERQAAEVSSEEAITEEALSNFIVKDKETIGWPFGRGAILPASYGEVTAEVAIADVAVHVQNDTAKSLFTVPDIPRPTPSDSAPRQISQGDCRTSPCVALTFDDGPGSHTSRLLDMLEQRGVKGTFYVLGSKVSAHASLMQRMQANGHQIGNHTWNHPDLRKLSATEVADELNRTNDAIRQVTGKAPTTARPPYGATNSAVMEQLRQSGLSAILWSVDTRDWADRDSQIVCSRAVANARSGAIILLHDIHRTSVDAVPCIVDALKNQGYRMVTVDELLGPTTPGVTYTNL